MLWGAAPDACPMGRGAQPGITPPSSRTSPPWGAARAVAAASDCGSLNTC